MKCDYCDKDYNAFDLYRNSNGLVFCAFCIPKYEKHLKEIAEKAKALVKENK